MNVYEAVKIYGVRAKIPGYESWANMKRRCNNPSSASYMTYGFLGITCSKNWETYDGFFADMGIRPAKGMSLDRIERELGYSKNNCRWATQTEQIANCKTTVRIRCFGEVFSTTQMAAVCGVSDETIRRWASASTFKCRVIY